MSSNILIKDDVYSESTFYSYCSYAAENSMLLINGWMVCLEFDEDVINDPTWNEDRPLFREFLESLFVAINSFHEAIKSLPCVGDTIFSLDSRYLIVRREITDANAIYFKFKLEQPA